MYPKVRCIVTCRPHASLGMSLTADAEIKLKGFSKVQARHYVDIYFIQKYPSNRKLAEQESSRLWNEVESSPDLLEMSINPSMLQILCKMFSATRKIAKDRATVFKDYTYFLLQQKHVKLHKKPVSHTELKNMYKGTLLKAGHLALQGLKQSHLQLIFTKESVIELAGKEMFEIGFVTEVPGHGIDKPKAQFQHKTHQEYLAAYFIVESPDDVGIRYLMEFCSTSKQLMGSKIILTFITSMSKKMGRVIQKKIRELVSSWKSEDDISPKDRTSFLLTMLMENNFLSFPLPKEIDINVRDYEKSIGLFQKISQKFGKMDPLETFFTFDNRGVEKITIVLGKEYRLELMKDFDKSQLQDVSVNFQKKSFQKDLIHLTHLIQNNEKLKILSLAELSTQDLLYLNKKSEFTSCLEKSNNLEIIKISECEPDIKTDLTDAFKHFPSHLELNISGNRFTNMSGCKALVQKAAQQKALIMQDCGLIIDTEIAEAIAQLPEQANLDLSGNTVTQMDSSLLCYVIPVISNKNIDLSGLGLVIDEKVATALSSLPKEVKVNLSGNQVTDKSACITLIHKAANMKSLSLCNCGIQIDTEIAEAVSKLPDHTELDLSGNELSNMKPDLLSRVLTYMTSQQDIDLNEWEITVDVNIVRAMSKLSKLKTINIISPNGKLTNQAAAEFPHTVSSMPDLLSLRLFDCDICNDVAVALTDSLSKHCPKLQVLDLSANNLSSGMEEGMEQMENLVMLSLAMCGIGDDEAVALTESLSKHCPKLQVLNLSYNDLSSGMEESVKHIEQMKNLEDLCLRNCGIDNDAAVALTESLSKHCPQLQVLNLGDNDLSSGMEESVKHIKHMKNLEELYLYNCGINNDTAVSLTQSLSKHCPKLQVLDLGYNDLSSGMEESVKHIEQMKNLEDLCLRNCGIDNDAAVALTESLSKHCPQLQVLNLGDNDLSSGMEESVKHIKHMKNLEELYLYNCGINNDTAVSLTQSLSKHCPKLQVLDLGDNDLSSGMEEVKHIQKMKNLKKLNLDNCGIQIDTEIAEAVSKLPDHTELDLSGNQVTDKSACITIMHKAANMKSLSICNCGIQIDKEIAEAVSRLPAHTELDLSDNELSNMKPDLLSRVLTYMTRQQEIDLNEWEITVDVNIVRAMSKLSKLKTINIIYPTGKLTNQAAAEFPHTVSSMPDLLSLRLFGCDISNDVAVAVTDSLSKHCPKLQVLDLSANNLSSGMEEVVKHIRQMENLVMLSLAMCGIGDDEAVALTESLSKHCPQLQVLNLSYNDLSSGMEEVVKHIQQMKNLKKLILDNCGTQIDTEIAEALSRFPDHTQLDLSGNQVTDKSACITLIHKAANMKSLSICNCGIQIDTEIAEAVSRLPAHTELDLSDNELSNMKPDLLSRVLTYMTSQQDIDLNEWEIKVDVNIVRAMSKLSKLKTINIIYPTGKLTNQV